MHTVTFESPSTILQTGGESTQWTGTEKAQLPVNKSQRSVLIVTAQSLLAQALSLSLSPGTGAGRLQASHADVVLAGVARSPQEAIEVMRTRNTAVHVLILDLDLIQGSVCEAIGSLLEAHPALRILALSTNNDLDRAVIALRAGACGYLRKDVEQDEFVKAVHDCSHRDPVVDSVTLRAIAVRAIGRQSVSEPSSVAAAHGLDRHEFDVLEHLARGRSNQEIAKELYVSVGSVKAYLTGASKKLGVHNRLQLLIRAYELGLVTPRLDNPRT